MPIAAPSASARPVLDTRPDPSSSSASPTAPQSSILPDGPRPELPLSIVAAASGSASSSSSAAAPPTPSSSSSQAPGPAAGGDDIEMEPILGHRRRKSSLMNPVGGISTAPGRPRDTSLRSPHAHAQSQFMGLSEEPKISEEGGPSDGPTTPKYEQPHDSFSDEDLHDDEETGLTDKERRKRQKKRRRNTLLDQRIARDRKLSADEQKEADKTVVKRLLVNGGLILMWYLFSLSISLYNKWMFDKDSLNFAFPLFTTSMHMLVQFVLSVLVLYFVPSLRPSAGHDSRHDSENGTIMSKMFYITRIGPCGAATGLDIGLGNTSLKFISLTFYTMCKSSSLAFVLIFAFLFRLEAPTWRLVAIIATMTLGVILMVFGEVEFKLGGFVLVISAAFFSGFRWGLTQILLLRNPATSNPFSSIFFLTPVMFLTLIALAFPVEGFWPLIDGLKTLSDEWGVFLTPLFLLFPGCIAFLMTAAEFALLQRTSVVTLSIAGIFKEVLTISAASVVFQDKLTVINLVGLLTTLVAIIAYNYLKISKMRQEAQGSTYAEHHPIDTSPSSSASDNEDEAEQETVGLLRDSVDRAEPLITSDGDIQTNLLPPSFMQADEPKEHRSLRED